MKHTFIAVMMLATAVFSGCKEEQDHTAQIEQIKAHIFEQYPATESISIKIERSTDLTIVLGNKALYASSRAKMQEAANELGVATIHIMGKENGLRQGNLVLTKNGRNESFSPADGIFIPIAIDSLNQLTQ